MRTLAVGGLVVVMISSAAAGDAKPPRALPSPRPAPQILAETPTAERMTTFVVALKHVAAADTAAAVSRTLCETHGYPEAEPGVAVDAPVVIVPDKAANSLVVVAQPRYIEEVRMLIEQADREPRQVEVDLKLFTTGEDGERRCLARPRLRSLTGQTAMLEIHSGEGTIEIELNVRELIEGDVKPVAATVSATANLKAETVRPPACAAEGNCSEEELRVSAQLDQPISLHCIEQPLRRVAEQLATSAQINVVLDTLGLEEQGVRTDDAVTINVEQIKLAGALDMLLQPLGLDYQVKDEVLKITSAQRALGPLEVRTYPVGDLVFAGGAKETKDAHPRYEELCELIRAAVQPNSWDVVGGACMLRSHEATLSLVVRQSRSGHEEIANLLDLLRKMTQVSRRDGPELRGLDALKQDEPGPAFTSVVPVVR